MDTYTKNMQCMAYFL